MVSHSSHTNHEFLILVIQITNVSFAIDSFVDNDVAYKEKFPTSKILVVFFFFNMTNLLQIKLWEVLQKTGRKNVSSKTPINYKTPVKLLAWHFTSKTSLYGWSRKKRLLLKLNIAALMFDLCLCLKILICSSKFKVDCAVK